MAVSTVSVLDAKVNGERYHCGWRSPPFFDPRRVGTVRSTELARAQTEP